MNKLHFSAIRVKFILYDYFIQAIYMVFILIERQIFVVSVAFYLTKIHWVVPEI